VHHCKLFEGIPGTEPVCKCFCDAPLIAALS
jgi:hypothetical protein